MCAILDVNVVSEVFGENRSNAGIMFREWIESGRGRLVTGGKARTELYRSGVFGAWAKVALRYGYLEEKADHLVDARTDELIALAQHSSDDPHILALALVSGVRLLWTNDRLLQQDFQNPRIINRPRGSLYPTGETPNAAKNRRRLLSSPDICRENHQAERGRPHRQGRRN